jgi:TonB family protein
VIPANVVDAAFNSGVKSAQTPPPTPVTTPPEPQPQPKPTPEPPQPKPVVKPPTPAPEPVPTPKPTVAERVKEFFKPEPPKPKPEAVKPVETPDKPTKPEPKKIKVSLDPVVRNAPSTADTSAADAAREARRQRDARLKAIASAAQAIKKNATAATTIEMPGEGSVSYANYASAVKSKYEAAWIPPNDASDDNANIKVSVTISRDGSVVTSRILDRSGDAQVDASVQRALDRVTFVAPFPDGAKEKERTFIINFNLKAKRMLG